METNTTEITADPRSPLPVRTVGDLLMQQLKVFYEQLGPETLGHIDSLYTTDVEFRDPVHTLHGCLALRCYLRKMASNLLEYRMRYLDEVVSGNSAYLSWEMDYAHRHLKGGRLITVRGMSLLKFTDKVFYHEDSYDLGALLYEHMPVIGFATRNLKSRMARL